MLCARIVFVVLLTTLIEHDYFDSFKMHFPVEMEARKVRPQHFFSTAATCNALGNKYYFGVVLERRSRIGEGVSCDSSLSMLDEEVLLAVVP